MSQMSINGVELKLLQSTKLMLAISFHVHVNAVIMPPFDKVGVYCFANVGRSVGQ